MDITEQLTHESRIALAAAAEITRLRARLEVRDDGGPDGILCRDESIRMQDAEIARLRAEVDALKAENAALASWQCLFTDGTTGLYHDGCGNAQCARDHLVVHLTAEVEALRADAERLTGERDVAIGMLAYWCVAVDQNGTGWDDWDEHYKDAMYRPCPIRELLDKEIDAARAAQGERG